MTRKDFIAQVGLGAAALLLPACLGSCNKNNTSPQQSATVDFTVDTSTGALATNGGYLVQNGVIVARTSTGTFLAVSASCTHAGGTLQYSNSSNSFVCPVHGATFNSSGVVTQGPAGSNLTQYKTSLSGHSLRVYS